MIVKVYCIINPISQSVFYVGCTKLDVNYRLRQHVLLDYSNTDNGGEQKKKSLLINEILKNKMYPTVKILCICSYELASTIEKYYYEYFTDRGETLLQKKYNCYYKMKSTWKK